MNRNMLAGLLCVVFLMGLGGVQYIRARTPSVITTPSGGQSMLPIKNVTVKGVGVRAETATTLEQKKNGLSQRDALPEGTGMLFVFDEPVTDGFWMKDMRFSIDIIWADTTGTIVTIFENLSPQTYPNIFRPSVPVTYVLELPAGFVAAHRVVVGDKVVL